MMSGDDGFPYRPKFWNIYQLIYVF